MSDQDEALKTLADHALATFTGDAAWHGQIRDLARGVLDMLDRLARPNIEHGLDAWVHATKHLPKD